MKVDDLDLLDELARRESRECFWAYRKYINPKMKIGWWQQVIAYKLQTFYESYVKGERPKLVIQAPPQHGKSKMMVDFITWMAGKDPDKRVIYTSFSERLGIRANLMCQRIYDSSKYMLIFPETKIESFHHASSQNSKYSRNRELIEYINTEGSFRNTTVRGGITGESLDIGIIDDPIKGREAAGSATVRDRTWDWFTDDFFTRFADDACMLAILTRWHVDDPIGRLIETFGADVSVVSYPAIAVADEKYRKQGDPLFPQLKSLPFLLERKKVMAQPNWESLYQQNPQIVGGELIKGEWFIRYDKLPPLEYRIIFADTASKTKKRNDYTVFECWGKGRDGRIYLIDLIRGKWESIELENRAVAFWRKHAAPMLPEMAKLREMEVEDESSGIGLIQRLKKPPHMIPIKGSPRCTDKYTRCLDAQPSIESGFVCVPTSAPFTSDFIAECEAFTADDSHMFDDQVDPMFDAIAKMLDTSSAASLWENQM